VSADVAPCLGEPFDEGRGVVEITFGFGKRLACPAVMIRARSATCAITSACQRSMIAERSPAGGARQARSVAAAASIAARVDGAAGGDGADHRAGRWIGDVERLGSLGTGRSAADQRFWVRKEKERGFGHDIPKAGADCLGRDVMRREYNAKTALQTAAAYSLGGIAAMVEPDKPRDR
jgi:hypothetical protein